MCSGGDIVRDENGALGVFQNLTANPTSVQGLNHCIAYGELPGHKTTQSDAIKAYVQSILKSEHKTWVSLPYELWPKGWEKEFTKPVVLLIKSLYGHPEAGAHWENHLTKILIDPKIMKGEKVPEFPSVFFFQESRLMLAVYVDDFTLSGPAEAHDAFWTLLEKHVDLEDYTPLGRVLGRQHVPVIYEGERALAFDMTEYAAQACELYTSLSASKPRRKAATPFVPDGSLCEADDDVRGELAGDACSVLMKDLWLGRLARPDLIKPIGFLATQVQNWTVNCDKQLYRLMCYIHTTRDYQLVGRILDPADQLKLVLFVDADFCGDRLHTKSTSGGFLVLVGPRSFFPLAWVSKTQTSTSRSTTESETISLAHSLFLEALPALSLWEQLLNRTVELWCLEDNEATIKVVQKGFSAKLRHIGRVHKVNLGSLSETFAEPNIMLMYVNTKEQAADIFTKGLEACKWQPALDMLQIVPGHLLKPIKMG